MAAPARKIEIREANEARILMAAEKIFGAFGYQGATTERIAREAGLPKANVHYYFRTKANLYRQVLKDVLDEWMVAAEAFEPGKDPEQALRSYVSAKMAFSRNRPDGSRVWAKEIMNGAPVMENFLGTQLKCWLEKRVQCIEGWIREGLIRPVEPRALLYMIWATTQHYADFERQIAILGNGKPPSDRQYQRFTEEVVALVLNSIGLSPHP